MLFGLAAPDFPNLFSILGPQAPFASHPPVIETQVQFIEGVLARALARGATRVEASPEATQAWSDLCDAILKVTLLEQGLDDRPWFLGANVPGKDPSTLCYLGGMAGFITATKQEAEADFPGFSFAGQPVLA
jgi:cyclohexanone monooxygenase